MRDRKKMSISILFQKVYLGWKLSPIIDRQGVGIRMSWMEKNRKINLWEQGVGEQGVGEWGVGGDDY